jgi:hypothetical protein
VDTVRVLRIIEYVGTREEVDRVVETSVHGTRRVSDKLFIRAATIGSYPEILIQTDTEDE